MAITLEELQIKFSAEMGALKSQLSGVQNQLGGLEKSADKSKSALAGMMKGGLAVAGALAARKLVQFGKDSLDMANDVVESEELFSVSMGKMESSARAWSESLSASLGLNAYDLRKNVGMLNVMFGSMGLGEQEAYDMSTSMVQLANDMASFYNLDTEEAFTKLRAGITGETEPLKRLGILVDEQTVAQYALKSGISKTGKELTQQQKLQARYGAIMEQTAKAQGDLARTMDSPTNQLRRLNAEFDMAKIALGQALQPALLAVIPVMTGFATGLTRVLKGGGVTTGNPFSTVVISLADATAAVKNQLSQTTTELMTQVNDLKQQVDTSIDEYIESYNAAKTLYLTLNISPKSNVTERVPRILRGLESYIGIATANGIAEDVEAKLNIIMGDGIVTGPERQSLISYLEEQKAELKKEADTKLKTIQAEAKYKLNTGEIDLPTADQMLIDAQAEYDATIGALDSVIADAIANLNMADWVSPNLSPEDMRNAQEAFNKANQNAITLVTNARLVVIPLFAGTGMEGVVDSLTAGGLEKIATWGEEMNAEFERALREGTDVDWNVISELQQKIAIYTEALTGGLTSGGKFQSALDDLRNATPETVTNFVKAYQSVVSEESGAIADRATQQREWLQNLKGAGLENELNAALKDFGLGTYDNAIATLKQREHEATAAFQGEMLQSAVAALAPQLQRLLNDPNVGYGETLDMSIAIDDLIRGINFDALDENGKEQYNALKTLLDGMQTLMVWQQNKGAFPRPTFDANGNPLPAYTSPPPRGPGSYGPTPTVEIDNPKVTINRPLQYTDTSGYGGVGRTRAETMSISIAPTAINVVLEVDGTTFGKAAITAQQTVTKNTGYGGGGVYVPMTK